MHLGAIRQTLLYLDDIVDATFGTFQVTPRGA